VLDVPHAQQGPHFPELVIHGAVGVEDELAREKLHVLRKIAVLVDGGVVVEAVLHADLVVLGTVARGDVDHARAGVEGHEGRQDEDTLAIDEGVLRLEAFHDLAGELVDDLVFLQLEGVHAIVHEVLRHDEDLARLLHLHGGVEEFLVEGDGQVGRDRPGGRRPDDGEDLLALQFRPQGRDVRDHGKLDVDGRRDVVAVLHLRLGQRRLAGGAPVDGLLALVDVACKHQPGELGRRDRLVLVMHGQVGIVPLAEHPEPFEFAALDVDKTLCVLAAVPPLLGLREAALAVAQLLVHLVLDGQTVAVPARHVDAVVARHILRLDDEVLDDLVEGRPEMDVAVGIRGAVVQDVGGTPPGDLPDLLVDTDLLPPPERLGLLSGEARLHGEIGLGQIEGGLVIHGTSEA